MHHQICTNDCAYIACIRSLISSDIYIMKKFKLKLIVHTYTYTYTEIYSQISIQKRQCKFKTRACAYRCVYLYSQLQVCSCACTCTCAGDRYPRYQLILIYIYIIFMINMYIKYSVPVHVHRSRGPQRFRDPDRAAAAHLPSGTNFCLYHTGRFVAADVDPHARRRRQGHDGLDVYSACARYVPGRRRHRDRSYADSRRPSCPVSIAMKFSVHIHIVIIN